MTNGQYKNMIESINRKIRYLIYRYNQLSRSSKVLFWILVGLHQVFGDCIVLFIQLIYVFKVLSNAALNLRQIQFGQLILIAFLIIASFPPLIGYGMLITICGFVYGFPNGIVPAAAGQLTGASIVFSLTRYLIQFPSIGNKFESFYNSRHWQAIGEAIKQKDLSLIILLRLCPFPPWVYANCFFALLPKDKLSFKNFLIATCCSTPRLLVHVFIGSRLFLLTDPNSNLDTFTQTIDIVSIAFGILLSFGLGVYVYKITMQKVRESVDYDIENENLLNEI